jgi:hypothetical protein
VASEDSASGWLPKVHRLSNSSDLDETVDAEVASLLHELDHFNELLEVLALCRPKPVRLEEGDDDLIQVAEPPNDVAVQRLTVIVPSPIDVDPAAPEVVAERFKSTDARSSLHHHELRLHLPTDRRGRIAMHRNGEATFAVDEPGYPPCDSQPFLLIVRTRHVVTIVNVASDVTTGSAGFSDVPAYSRLHRTGSLLSGATNPKGFLGPLGTCHLRTVIVTAAVYRGLVSRLRPEGLTSPLDLPAPGRRQPLYVVFRLRRDLCF